MKPFRKEILLSAFLTCLLVSVNIGCLQGKKRDIWKPVEQKTAPVVHTVQWTEETLPLIAKWYTGSDKNQEALADANPNIRPDNLSEGNKIFIPEALARTREAMPHEFLIDFYKKQQAKKSQRQKQSPSKEDEDAEFEVFGPK